MPEWYFEPFPTNGGFNAKAGRDLLQSADLRRPETLARESLQNACDAALQGVGPVRVTFRVEDLQGSARTVVLDALHVRAPGGPESRGLLELPEDLKLFFIEDHATRGLGGTDSAAHEPRPEDNFVRLCRNVGDTQGDVSGRGGTKGVGKSVYWSHSKIYLVAFYSRFPPTSRTGGVSSRFIAVGWFKDHINPRPGGRRYTGRAWFGDLRPENGESFVAPLTDNDADTFAESLGFTPRTQSDTGTSIMIVGASKVDDLYLAEIRHAVETHYWPRILDGDLEVNFSYGAVDLGGPELSSRLDLKDYYSAYRLARDENSDAADGRTVIPLTYSPQQSSQNFDLGKVAVIARGDSGEVDEVADDETSEVKGIALMRAPRMVVQYYAWGTPQVTHAGVFVASSQIEDILRRSEPPAHDQWKDDSEDLAEVESKVVKNLLPKLRGKVSEFLEGFVQEHVSDVTSSALLSQELASFLPLKAGGSGQGSSKRFASVQFISQPHRQAAEDGQQRLVAELTVSVTASHIKRYRQRYDRDPDTVAVQARILPVVENGKRLTKHPIGIDTLADQSGDGVREGAELRIPVAPGLSRRVIVISDILPDPALTFDMSIAADLRSLEENGGRSD